MLLCNIDEKPRIIGREKEEEHWDTNVHLIASAPELRALGAFAGGVAQVLLGAFGGNELLVANVARSGGLISGILGAIGHLFGGGAAQKDQGQQEAAVQPPPPEPPIEFGGGFELSGHSEKDRVVYAMPHVRFHQRVCATISKPRVKADGTARSSKEGFDVGTFFDGYLLRFSLIGKDRVDQLMNTSWYEDAIDLRPDRHPDPPVKNPGDDPKEYPVENGLYPMPLVFDIHLVEENLRDLTQPLYILFHKALHPDEVIRFYRHQEKAAEEIVPPDQGQGGDVLPAEQQGQSGSIL
jgi:hypothetical protein